MQECDISETRFKKLYAIVKKIYDCMRRDSIETYSKIEIAFLLRLNMRKD